MGKDLLRALTVFLAVQATAVAILFLIVAALKIMT
jgi:hypothetical protein